MFVVNGFPIDDAFIMDLPRKYSRIVTVEDGLIGTVESGLRGFAGYVAGKVGGNGVELDHFGIVDPRIAPSETFLDVWAHYGMTADAITEHVTR